jgi:hypothetical protein
MMKMAVLVCLVISGATFAAESKSKVNDLGFTKEQHMAAEAACKSINADMRGRELKDCIKQKLGIVSQ